MPLSNEDIELRAGPRMLDDDAPDGTRLAWDGTFKYAATGAQYNALNRGVACGSIATMATSQSPTSVDTRTTAERTLTPYVGAGVGTGAAFTLTSGDFLMVNKPSTQAGLGIATAARVSGSNAIAVFSNWSSATVTPTAGEKYGIVAIRGMTTLTAVLTPAAVSPAMTAEQQFTIPGLRAGEVVAVSKAAMQTTLSIVGARVVEDDVLAINFGNTSASATITPTAGETYTIWSTGGLDECTNNLLVQAHIGASGGPTGTANAELGVTVTGLATSDAVVGVMKPTFQAGAALIGARVSGANALALAFSETAATVTPTANEVYSVQLFRPNPLAPCVIYSSTYTPTAVGPNTTVAKAFTVTGVPAGSVVIANRSQAQPGLGIVGARVSAADTVEVTLCNATANTITPAAGETWSFANFQQAIPDAGSAWVYTVSQQQMQSTVLLNAIRNLIQTFGGIA